MELLVTAMGSIGIAIIYELVLTQIKRSVKIALCRSTLYIFSKELISPKNGIVSSSLYSTDAPLLNSLYRKIDMTRGWI